VAPGGRDIRGAGSIYLFSNPEGQYMFIKKIKKILKKKI
jgi:hypothetical protein